MSEEDMDLLLSEVSTVYSTHSAVEELLRYLRFPRGRIPSGETSSITWSEIFYEFDNGLISMPYRRLLGAALRVYASNPVFNELHERYIRGPQEAAARGEQRDAPLAGHDGAPAPPAANGTPPTDEADRFCHIIVRAGSEEERAGSEKVLRELGMDPQTIWATAHAISFRVGTDDAPEVRRRLDRTSLGWTLVPPGQRDYLLSSIYVEGPDGRNFRVVDPPAQQTLGNVASEVIDHYPAFHATPRPAVIDQVQPDGQGRRLDPEATLDEAGLRDGDQLRVGFQATAGAVNPLDREDALYRARNQIIAYAESHGAVTVRANSTLMPTEYEVGFRERSFAPPPPGDAEPVESDGPHLVLIELGPQFPMTPPHVFWLSPIFHPNVYPGYDGEAARARPQARGLVCLGALGESYQPSLDFGELCQTLTDMAGFRNYGLFEPTGRLDEFGEPELRGNYYDAAAARWVHLNQDRIAAIGGQPWGSAPPRTASRYRNVVEAIDP
jgi:Effector-associated domain 1